MMKYLLVWTVILIAISIFWRNSRQARDQKEQSTPNGQRPVVDMVPCRWCGIHIPQTEAVRGAQGNYCSMVHQSKAEGGT